MWGGRAIHRNGGVLGAGCFVLTEEGEAEEVLRAECGNYWGGGGFRQGVGNGQE